MQSPAGLVVFLVATGLTAFVPVTVAEAERRPTVVSADERGAASSTKPTSEKAAEPQPVITLKEGRLTVQVQSRPLGWVLDEISRESRLAIVRAPGVGDQSISVQLKDAPPDEALRVILTAYDAFFFYGVEKNVSASLRVVWVYPRGGGRGFAPVPPWEWGSTKEFLREARTNPDPAGRAQAVEMLVERSGEQSADVVRDFLVDPDDAVRTRALYSALNAGVRIPVDSLAQMALSDPSPHVRFLALDALANNPRGWTAIDVGAVVAQALNDPSPHMRAKAEEIFRRLGAGTQPSGQPDPAQHQPQRQ